MRRTTTLSQDERAIEGLPIRLVIALVVGVASLAIMMQMIGGLGFNAQKEVTVEFTTNSLVSSATSGGGAGTFGLKVVTEDGEPVPNAQVLITSGTATLMDNPIAMTGGSPGASTSPSTTGEDGTISHNIPCAKIDCGAPSGTTSKTVVDFRSDQDKGTLKFDIVLQGDGNYKDEKPNPELVVTQ